MAYKEVLNHVEGTVIKAKLSRLKYIEAMSLSEIKPQELETIKNSYILSLHVSPKLNFDAKNNHFTHQTKGEMTEIG